MRIVDNGEGLELDWTVLGWGVLGGLLLWISLFALVLALVRWMF